MILFRTKLMIFQHLKPYTDSRFRFRYFRQYATVPPSFSERVNVRSESYVALEVNGIYISIIVPGERLKHYIPYTLKRVNTQAAVNKCKTLRIHCTTYNNKCCHKLKKPTFGTFLVVGHENLCFELNEAVLTCTQNLCFELNEAVLTCTQNLCFEQNKKKCIPL